MKVWIDGDLCQGHGQCNMVCPEVFVFDEQGFAQLAQRARQDVAPEYAAGVARAAEACPEQAIRVEG